MAAKNAVLRTVADYAPDPNGAALFSSLTGAIGRTLNSAAAVVPRSATWQGWTRPLQRMTGAAGVAALGAARVYAPKSSELNDQREEGNANAGTVFAARMGRTVR